MTKYSETGAYQNMTKSQRIILDNADQNGIYGGLRSAKAWKEKRAKMTPEELKQIEQKDKLNEWTSKWALIGMGVALFIFCALLMIGEMSGNPLIPY